jgi:benzodiazapine receptor
VTWTIIVAASAAALVLAAGALLTDIGPWYRNLRKPAWQPPDWAFGPAWTIIMALVAVAGVLGWRAARGHHEHTLLIALFLINGTLHVSWSLLFFRLKRPDWALVEVVLFWLSIVAITVFLCSISYGAVDDSLSELGVVRCFPQFGHSASEWK